MTFSTGMNSSKFKGSVSAPVRPSRRRFSKSTQPWTGTSPKRTPGPRSWRLKKKILSRSTASCRVSGSSPVTEKPIWAAASTFSFMKVMPLGVGAQPADDEVAPLGVGQAVGVDGDGLGGADRAHVRGGDVAHGQAAQLDAEDVVAAAAEGDDAAVVEGVDGGLLAGQAAGGQQLHVGALGQADAGEEGADDRHLAADELGDADGLAAQVVGVPGLDGGVLGHEDAEDERVGGLEDGRDGAAGVEGVERLGHVEEGEVGGAADEQGYAAGLVDPLLLDPFLLEVAQGLGHVVHGEDAGEGGLEGGAVRGRDEFRPADRLEPRNRLRNRGRGRCTVARSSRGAGSAGRGGLVVIVAAAAAAHQGQAGGADPHLGARLHHAAPGHTAAVQLVPIAGHGSFRPRSGARSGGRS